MITHFKMHEYKHSPEEVKIALNWLKQQPVNKLIKVNVNTYRILKRLSNGLWVHNDYNIVFFDGSEIRINKTK
jgi:hypothetical protein